MIIGTCHFVSRRRAVQYYRPYIPVAAPGEVSQWVGRKLVAGEIKIGPPEVKPGERMFLNDEGRFCIESYR